jgi:hypothetical protein
MKLAKFFIGLFFLLLMTFLSAVFGIGGFLFGLGFIMVILFALS